MITFKQVFDREFPFLTIRVDIAGTRARRSDCESGLWKLDRDWLMIILKEVSSRRGSSIASLVEQCDSDAHGPMFQDAHTFAEFIDNVPPILKIDFDAAV